jgi:uncharacterized SAM-binding protein YcdF (DUF218 family)
VVRVIAWHVLSVGDLLALSLIVGVLLQSFRRGGARSNLLIKLSAVGFALMLFLPIGSWAIAPLEQRFPLPKLPAEIDGIVLLTGAINVRATLKHDQPVFYPYAERITSTVVLARRFPRAHILITGGRDRPDEPSEAAVHRELLMALGSDETRIEIENKSHNTCESAYFSYRKVHPRARRWVLVTSAFHLPRAVACFRSAGWDVIPYPAGYKAQDGQGIGLIGNLATLRLALHEWVGLAAYYLMGRIHDIFPAPDASDPGEQRSKPPTVAVGVSH